MERSISKGSECLEKGANVPLRLLDLILERDPLANCCASYVAAFS
jgi:hypothetical protein